MKFIVEVMWMALGQQVVYANSSEQAALIAKEIDTVPNSHEVMGGSVRIVAVNQVN